MQRVSTLKLDFFINFKISCCRKVQKNLSLLQGQQFDTCIVRISPRHEEQYHAIEGNCPGLVGWLAEMFVFAKGTPEAEIMAKGKVVDSDFYILK